MKYILSFFCYLFLVGCSDNEDFFLDTDKESLTVEAYVELDKAPIVYLTTGLPVDGFSDIDVLKSIESRAKVEVFDGENNEIATFSTDNDKFPSRFYTFEDIKGKLNTEYHLKITIGDKEYISSTSIPKQPKLQSASSVKQSTFKEGIYNIRIDLENFSEDSYYKFYVKNMYENEFKKASVFVVSNNLQQGDTLRTFIDYWSYEEDGTKISLLEAGSTYDLRIVSITEEEFLFWERILGSQTQIVSLPSLTQEVPTNISNEAFGFFSGNSEIFTQVTIQE